MSEINRPISLSTSNINTPRQVSTEVVTHPKLYKKLLENSDESAEGSCELTAEQNSQNRNKNEKKTNLVYLDACPGWDTFNINKKTCYFRCVTKWQYFSPFESRIQKHNCQKYMWL